MGCLVFIIVVWIVERMPLGPPAPSVPPREVGEDASAVVLHQANVAAAGPLAGCLG
jgi:hypothetical protein